DVGSPAWGWVCQDPGRLLHEVMPKHLDGHAEIHWLDAMCRELTMKLLSPNAKGDDRYFDSAEKSLAVAEITVKDTVRGWGGPGPWRSARSCAAVARWRGWRDSIATGGSPTRRTRPR